MLTDALRPSFHPAPHHHACSQSRTPPHCGPDTLRIYGVPPRSNRGRFHPQSRLQNSQVQTLESHFCLKYTYMPIWLILHQRITNNFSFLYFIYIITLTFKCIICVIFFCNSHDSSGPTGIILDNNMHKREVNSPRTDSPRNPADRKQHLITL